MIKENEQKVIPLFKIQEDGFHFEMDKLTLVERVSREKESLMMAILDTINDGVVTIDFNMRITSFNRAAERITGYSTKEALGKPCMDIFCAGVKIDRSKCLADCTMKLAVAEGKSITRKKKIVSKCGEVLTISSTATILYDLNRHPIGGMSTFTDITPFEKLKEECQGRQYILGNIVGQSAKMIEIYKLIDSISESRSNVLILGETGTGKGLIANAIHFSSIYRKGPFIHVNCASLPENLLESELFGHVRGAFTGAVSDHQGRLELAQGGTLFLDEISELTPAMQAKFLKVVEEKRFERVGGSKTIHVDVRIISASNRDIEKEIKSNRFREDLYYRLNIIPIHVPSLRDRKEDIPFIIEHIIEKLTAKTKKNIRGVSSEVLDIFLKYSWPGNVRELENVLEYASLHCKEDYIDLAYLPPVYKLFKESSSDISEAHPTPFSNGDSSQSIDLNGLIKALEGCRWNKIETAKRLNVSRTTLWRLMKKYGLNQ
ncbi:MAG: PAS domain S-box protein [Deltaproteobacteria bacterium]|nr:PAS domain S-box protein [Deltaproteobacteria bacterium]